MVELRTRRLVLRRWQAEDRAPFARMNADACVMRHFPAPLSQTESDKLIDSFEARWERDGTALLAVTQHDGTFLGAAGLMRTSVDAHFTPCVEVGWRFARTAWGKGYATEAAKAAIAWGFQALALDEIVSFTASSNTRSERVMQRLGMRPAGTFDHPSLPAGHPLQRHVLYRHSRASWLATRTGG